jgi:hypothetical protein
MSLEEHTLEQAGDRCEECGATLTASEQQVVLERGGPNLCSMHLNEVAEVAPEPGDDDLVG